MDFYGNKNLWKLILLIFAVLIGAITLWYTEGFLNELRQEEIKKVNQWSSAVSFVNRADQDEDLSFHHMIIQSNNTIPIIWTDAEGNLIESRNIKNARPDDREWVKNKIDEMKEEAEPIEINLGGGQKQYIYYQNSILLTQLRYYPVVLLVVIALFIFIAYIAFSNARKAEQNQVWNGLAKETAHQIGTPLTSLMGWLELIKSRNGDEVMVTEMEKDITRLNTITQRFSKIGSQPSISPHNIVDVTLEAMEYLQNRSPKKIQIRFHSPMRDDIQVDLNKPLFEWVIENLIRNAIDAIEGKQGKIDIYLSESSRRYIRIDVKDSGKGIPSNKQKTVFRPGYTTKSRGWGLGLSLARRIIEKYHRGKIYVAQSELGAGTTFRILLRKTRKE